jgi:hypothetical protein
MRDKFERMFPYNFLFFFHISLTFHSQIVIRKILVEFGKLVGKNIINYEEKS